MSASSINRLQKIRRCFAVTGAVGLYLMVYALYCPVLAHFQLDVVLTPEELRDVHFRKQALAILERVTSPQWKGWLVVGTVVTAASVVGFRLAREERAE